ncbi:AAA family ATPase [Acinetobacter oleivorans]|uniref:AAA family ATPase n=2 Tax=Moraxellaceae TaxID=468 RepID=UPI00124F0844|nr:ATP-binding protein [Acinetobacter oleivorans]
MSGKKDMIIDFSVQNFRSIRDEQKISFEADNSKDLENYFVFTPNLLHPKKTPLRLLKLNFIYGANASGKSNILKALHALDILAIRTSKSKDEEVLFIEPFAFDSTSQDEPTKFVISFVANEIIYRYELTVNKKCILEEALYSVESGTGLLFHRTTDTQKQLTAIDIKSRCKMKADDRKTLSNSTLWNSTVLSTYHSLNIESEHFDNVVNWFIHTLMQYVEPDTDLKSYISKRIEDKKIDKANVLMLMQEADFCVNDLSFKPIELTPERVEFIEKLKTRDTDVTRDLLENLLNEKELFFTHKVANGKYELNYDEESLGTQRYYQLSGLLDFVTRQNKVIAIDEFESSLHPDLIKHFLVLYLKTKHESQMLITTHYREFLSQKDLFRKDAIWFVEKDQDESFSEIYSLADFSTKTIRETSSVYNAYVTGKLGAVPNI